MCVFCENCGKVEGGFRNFIEKILYLRDLCECIDGNKGCVKSERRIFVRLKTCIQYYVMVGYRHY